MELLRTLASLAEPPDEGHERLAQLCGLPTAPTASDFTDLFILQLYPYASVHLGPEGMLGGVARDRVAGFFRTLDATPPHEPDHLAVLLTAAAELADREAAATDTDAAAAWRRSRNALLWEHVLPWMPVFAERVTEQRGPYAPWAQLLLEALQHEAEAVSPAADLSLHLRDAPPLADPRTDEGVDLLAQILAPVRTGMVLTRADLARCAREICVGGRIGERRYVLSALLSQDAGDVLAWLADEAERRATAHRHRTWTGPLANWWADRAGSAAVLLRDLAADADAALAEAGESPATDDRPRPQGRLTELETSSGSIA